MPILFDMDGTLLDSAPAVVGRIQETLEHFGVAAPPADELHIYIGPPTPYTMGQFLPESEVAAATAFYRSLSERDGLAKQTLFPGIPALLAALAEAGRPLGVASSKPQDEIDHIVEHFGIAEYFTAVVGAEDHRPEKADVVRQALIDLEKHLHEAAPVLVGDRIWDVEGAAAEGLPTVMVDWGYAAESEFAHAIARAASTDALLDYLLTPAPLSVVTSEQKK